MFFLIVHNPKGWVQVHMFINPISVTFLRLPTIFYSSNHASNAMTDPTKSRSTPTHSLYVLPNTYSKRMDSSPYVYQPNISLVLVITYAIIVPPNMNCCGPRRRAPRVPVILEKPLETWCMLSCYVILPVRMYDYSVRTEAQISSARSSY
jgi:hypothetical protein